MVSNQLVFFRYILYAVTLYVHRYVLYLEKGFHVKELKKGVLRINCDDGGQQFYF